MKRFRIAPLLLCIGTLSGCSAEGLRGAEASETDDVASVNQAFVSTWDLGPTLGFNVKLARSPQGVQYAWDDTPKPTANKGNVCQGDTFSSCQVYTVPMGKTTGDIRAIGIAQDTSHVYTWYSDETVTEGNSVTLGKYNTYRFQNVSGFPMSALLDADVSPNGAVYYYWSSGASVWRTTGTSDYSGLNSNARKVATQPSIIQGISFWHSGSIEAWYMDGTFVISSNSLFLDH